MVKRTVVERNKCLDVEKQRVEIVERKGLGHPDSMADAIAERFSRNLAKYYIKKFGTILHYNVDKLEIIGGETKPLFKGGRILKPITILFSGRATSVYNYEEIPVEEIAKESAKSWIKENIRFLDPESIKFLFETKRGSANLSDAFRRKNKIYANDTSFGVGYAPMSRLERLVLNLERYMNSKEFKSLFPYSGEDIKIMGVRNRKLFIITIAMAFVDKFVDSEIDYFKKKHEILKDVRDFLERKGLYERSNKLEYSSGLYLRLNRMDRKDRGINGCYLTVTGTSAENGDDGAVGRGNRANGLITPNRSMTLEAISGKNPVNHIGKLYSIFAFQLANKIYEKFGFKNQVKIIGNIGDDISDPATVSVMINEVFRVKDKHAVRDFVEETLPDIMKLKDQILNNEIDLP